MAGELKLTLLGAGWSRRVQEPLVIGSDADCDLQILDANVGGRHAEIYSVGTQWWVRDLGSEDGTFLEGEIVEAEPLGTPSEIRLGVGGPTLLLEGQRGPIASLPRPSRQPRPMSNDTGSLSSVSP